MRDFFAGPYNQAPRYLRRKVHVHIPPRTVYDCRSMLAFVSIDAIHHEFSSTFSTAIEILSLCTSMPDILVIRHKWCSFFWRG